MATLPQTTSVPPLIRRLIAEQMPCHESHVTRDALLEFDLGADSIDRLELMMEFEDRFKIEIDEADVQAMYPRTSVGDVLAILSALGVSQEAMIG